MMQNRNIYLDTILTIAEKPVDEAEKKSLKFVSHTMDTLDPIIHLKLTL